MADYVAALHTD